MVYKIIFADVFIYRKSDIFIQCTKLVAKEFIPNLSLLNITWWNFFSFIVISAWLNKFLDWNGTLENQKEDEVSQSVFDLIFLEI